MLLAILSGFLFAAALVPLSPYFKGRVPAWSALLPAALFAYFLSLLPAAAGGTPVVHTFAWAPSFGVTLRFHADGLGLLFALIISGVGALVFWYASNYMKGHKYLARFYAYLGIFMGAMLGLVLSDNLISLFIFWELTSISSFFLIGFKNEDAASRKSAIVALAVTGLGGLLLLVAVLLMGRVSGSYSIQEMLQDGVVFQEHPWYSAIVWLVFGAAFTKSAQFPFHFWLPGAMKAPTPVSTYLHSATMVKAGIYLLLRLSPLLGNHATWQTPLYMVGGITMLYAAVHTLLRTDLKSILAYTTISALGILTFLTGIGTPEALLAACMFVLVHALYKAALFLITGIIDHETGTRDVTQLSGLGRVMRPVALAGFAAAFSSAGIPLTMGFIGKDLVYEATLHAGPTAAWFTTAALLTNVMLLAGGFTAGIRPFTGPLPEAFSKAHMPPLPLWLPPALLAALSIFFGMFPAALEWILIKPAAHAAGAGSLDFHLKLWHGFNTVLGLSALTIGAGVGLFFAFKPSQRWEAGIARAEWLSPQRIAEQSSEAFHLFSQTLSGMLESGYLRYYVRTIILFATAVLGYHLLTGVKIYINYAQISELVWYEVVILGIMAGGILFAVFTTSRLTAVAAMGVVGYAICLLFVFYSAPDLAMTQFTIDTLTVILFVLVLYRLPKYLLLSDTPTRLRDGALALLFGAFITVSALEVLSEPHNRQVGDYYAENAYLLAKGKNIVNVILVDFRGADTAIEIAVLVVAAIGVLSLLRLKPAGGRR